MKNKEAMRLAEMFDSPELIELIVARVTDRVTLNLGAMLAATEQRLNQLDEIGYTLKRQFDAHLEISRCLNQVLKDQTDGQSTDSGA